MFVRLDTYQSTKRLKRASVCVRNLFFYYYFVVIFSSFVSLCHRISLSMWSINEASTHTQTFRCGKNSSRSTHHIQIVCTKNVMHKDKIDHDQQPATPRHRISIKNHKCVSCVLAACSTRICIRSDFFSLLLLRRQVGVKLTRNSFNHIFFSLHFHA